MASDATSFVRELPALRWPRFRAGEAAALLLCLLLFFPALGLRDLTSAHEARAAQNAQSILLDGDWLLPRLFDRHVELQKPPLYYWLVAAIAQLRGGGVDVWAVRLPSAMAALGTVLCVYFMAVRQGRRRAGLAAAVMLATCWHFTWMAGVGRIDMPLTFTTTLTIVSFSAASTSNHRWRWQLLAYVALALGVLLKGPIALVLAAIAGSLWNLGGQGEGWSLRRSSLKWGLPLTLALAAPWFVWANLRTNNQLWEVFFWYHNVERGLGSETLKPNPWWFYFARTAIDAFPWSLLLPVAGWRLWVDPRLRRDPLAVRGLLWFGAVLAFLSLISFKRADYLLPAYPGLALALGAIGESLWQAYPQRRRLIVGAFATVAACVLIGWSAYHAWLAAGPEGEWPYRRFAQEIRKRTPGPVIFFRAESHVLAFHVGKPIDTILEWENLDIWAGREGPIYFVMPEHCARESEQHLSHGPLDYVLHLSDFMQGPAVERAESRLVVMCSRKRGD